MFRHVWFVVDVVICSNYQKKKKKKRMKRKGRESGVGRIGRYVSMFQRAIGSSDGMNVPRKRLMECCFSASVNELE